MTEDQTPPTDAPKPRPAGPLPPLSTSGVPQAEPTPGGDSFRTVMESPAYSTLRSTFRRFAFPMTVAGLASYFTYVILSIYAPALMGTPALGALNWGSLIGLAQFAVTWIWTAIYVRFANHRLDSAAAELKAQLEKRNPA